MLLTVAQEQSLQHSIHRHVGLAQQQNVSRILLGFQQPAGIWRHQKTLTQLGVSQDYFIL